MEFSWQPYEELCLQELLARVGAFETAEEVDALEDPFLAMRFLQARGQLQGGYLRALSQWCLRGVHRPNVRSERRPTARQLLVLHDMCYEHGVEDDPALQDALAYYVESAGGRWGSAMPKALKYQDRRVYIRTEDPVETSQALLPEPGSAPARPARRRETEDLFGLPSAEHELEASEASESGVESRHQKKPSAASPSLEPDESTVGCWIDSRKGPRPRTKRDPGFKRHLRKDVSRPPLWMQGGWSMRPKYQRGENAWRILRRPRGDVR